jgi:HSP20 family protein
MKKEKLKVTAEMHGITKQDIKVEVSDKDISIYAEKGDKKYYTNIPVDAKLDDKPTKISYTNDILKLDVKVKELLNSELLSKNK